MERPSGAGWAARQGNQPAQPLALGMWPAGCAAKGAVPPSMSSWVNRARTERHARKQPKWGVGGAVERPGGADWAAGRGKQAGRSLTLKGQGRLRCPRARSHSSCGRSCEDGGDQSDTGEYGGGTGRCTDPPGAAWVDNGHQTGHNRRPRMCRSGCAVTVLVAR